ncbi:hypothetical protein CASFOL_014543 [Castilleja foliolosa]|uniref:Uncharacterized protein n=1 Tax=Castilleja foliolosa TaxID=1961234 RepID=A0ABD3DNR9_9LAMI
MGCTNVSKPVFVETNLGTRLAAVPGSPDITAKEFKRELERTHLSCFPEIGRIKVNALKVKKRSRFYHLSESLPLKYAFLDSNATWFLQMDVHQIKHLNPNKGKKVEIQRYPFPAILCVLKQKKKRKNRKRKTFKETFSDVVSVSGIIKKYFSDDEEVGSTPYSSVQTVNKRKYYLNRETHAKPEVGKRLLLAKDNLGLNLSNQRPLLSLCRSGNRKMHCKSTAVVRDSVFEMMSEESD